MELRKLRRQEEWQKFNINMKRKYAEADDQFAKQEENIKELYAEQENKLNEISAPPR